MAASKLGPGRDDLTAALAAGVERLTTSKAWERYLAYQANFHRYSFGNVMLIAEQRPGATRVAGFATWRSLGRSVRRGESAIWILAPVHRRANVAVAVGEEEVADVAPHRSIGGFRRVAVFDIAQTDGEPPPEVVLPLAGAQGAEAFAPLVELAHELGYGVDDADLGGSVHGECAFAERRIRVERADAPAQRTKTLVHEIAHALLHEREVDRALAELEAESVAFVVCRALGLDTGAYSFGYVATWAGGGERALEAIRESAERIGRTARALLDGLAADRPWASRVVA